MAKKAHALPPIEQRNSRVTNVHLTPSISQKLPTFFRAESTSAKPVKLPPIHFTRSRSTSYVENQVVLESGVVSNRKICEKITSDFNSDLQNNCHQDRHFRMKRDNISHSAAKVLSHNLAGEHTSTIYTNNHVLNRSNLKTEGKKLPWCSEMGQHGKSETINAKAFSNHKKKPAKSGKIQTDSAEAYTGMHASLWTGAPQLLNIDIYYKNKLPPIDRSCSMDICADLRQAERSIEPQNEQLSSEDICENETSHDSFLNYLVALHTCTATSPEGETEKATHVASDPSGGAKLKVVPTCRSTCFEMEELDLRPYTERRHELADRTLGTFLAKGIRRRFAICEELDKCNELGLAEYSESISFLRVMHYCY